MLDRDSLAQLTHDTTTFLNHPGLQGRAFVEHLGQGLHIKSTRWAAAADGCFPHAVFEPALRIVFLLQGAEHLRIGSVKIDLKATKKPLGLWLPVGEVMSGEKFFYANETQDEFVLFMSGDRLDRLAQGISPLPAWYGTGAQQHLKFHTFEITSPIKYLIGDLRNVPKVCPLTTRLEQEALAMALFKAVCQQMLIDHPRQSPLNREAKKRVADLTLLLQSGQADHWTLGEMARYCGSNVSSLQRHCREVTGLTIGDYLRKLKLERAHRALMMGVSVSQAADVAQYKHIESFTKAFKQQFGCTPGQIKTVV